MVNIKLIIFTSEQLKMGRIKKIAKKLSKLFSRSKRKTKRLFYSIILIFNLTQALAPCAAAVMLPLPRPAMHRLSSIEDARIKVDKDGLQLNIWTN